MKKIAILLICLQLILSFSAFAADGLSISYGNELSGTVKVQRVYVKGNCGVPNDRVFVLITDSSDNIASMGQVTSEADGSFSCILGITAPTDGMVYNVISNSEKGNTKLTGTLTIKSETELTNLIETLKGMELAAFKQYVEDNSDAFGLDKSYYTEEFEDDIIANLYASKAELTLYNITEKFDSSVLCGILNSESASNDDRKNVLSYYDDAYIKIKTSSDTSALYSEYEDFDSELKDRTIERLISTPLTDKNQVKDRFAEAIVLTGILDDDAAAADSFILETNSYINLNGYEAGSEAKRFSYVSYIKGANPSTLALLRTSYQAIYNIENPPYVPPVPSYGGGGGGGGGSTIGYEKPTETTVPVPDNSDKKEEDKKPAVSFSDMEGYEWAKTATENLFVRGVVEGKESGKFYPGDNISRAEFVKMITVAFGVYNKDAKCDFSDVSADSWYYSYVASAVDAGIVSGTSDTTFSPSKQITREDMATIIYRYLNLNKKIYVYESLENKFEDFDKISHYAQNSVLMLSNMGVLSGKDNNCFCPKDNAKRAEACVMIYNSLEVARDD